MKTVAGLIAELQKFPLDARYHAYEGEPIKRADGKAVHSYIVVTGANGESFWEFGYVPCSEDRDDDGPAVQLR